MSYSFRAPECESDWDAVRRLNHRTFAEELGQHDASAEGRLVDPMETRSRYVVALHGSVVVGMVCAHDDPPYSVEKRLHDTAILDRLPAPLVEVRLLAIDAGHRNGMVLAGLLGTLMSEEVQAGQGTVIISGVAGRQAMYERMGFRPLGPPVMQGTASFVPMALRLDDLPPHILTALARWLRRSS